MLGGRRLLGDHFQVRLLNSGCFFLTHFPPFPFAAPVGAPRVLTFVLHPARPLPARRCAVFALGEHLLLPGVTERPPRLAPPFLWIYLHIYFFAQWHPNTSRRSVCCLPMQRGEVERSGRGGEGRGGVVMAERVLVRGQLMWCHGEI